MGDGFSEYRRCHLELFFAILSERVSGGENWKAPEAMPQKMSSAVMASFLAWERDNLPGILGAVGKKV